MLTHCARTTARYHCNPGIVAGATSLKALMPVLQQPGGESDGSGDDVTSGGSPNGSASGASSASVAKPLPPRSSSVVDNDGSVRMTPLSRDGRISSQLGVSKRESGLEETKASETDHDAKAVPSPTPAQALAHVLAEPLKPGDQPEGKVEKRFTPHPPSQARWARQSQRDDMAAAVAPGALSPRVALVRNALAATKGTPKSARERARSSTRQGVASPMTRAHSRLGGAGGTLRSGRARSVMGARVASPFERSGSVALGNTDMYKKRLGTLAKQPVLAVGGSPPLSSHMRTSSHAHSRAWPHRAPPCSQARSSVPALA